MPDQMTKVHKSVTKNNVTLCNMHGTAEKKTSVRWNRVTCGRCLQMRRNGRS